MSKITPSKNAIVYIITTIITAVSLSTGAGTVVSTVPDSPDPSASYLFYLHGRGVDMGHSGAKKAYHKNVEALSKQGFVVVSEARRKDAIKKFPHDYEKYAQKIADEVKKLLEAGVPAGEITVSGYSRGGVLTLIASGLIGNSDINFAIMAGCMADTGAFKKVVPTVHDQYSPKLEGRFLSLYDTGDEDFGSCKDYFSKASGSLDYEEIALATGKGHLTFREPMDEWLQPLINWTGIQASKN